MTPPRVMVGLPVYQDIPPMFVQCLLALQANPPCAMELAWRMGSPEIGEVRNQITADFLASECTHLLFIDCDILFTPEKISRLLSHDDLIVSGLYPFKVDGPLRWVATPDPAGEKRGALQKVIGIGAGFMLIKREVFEAIGRDQNGKYLSHDDARWEFNFWQHGTFDFNGKLRYLNEDYAFCKLAADAGFTIWADTGCPVQHIGRATWPMSHQVRIDSP